MFQKNQHGEKKLQKIIDDAIIVVLASGTLSRNDKKEIAFLNYENGIPLLKNSDETRIINYNRHDALMEKAIVPLDFEMIDCSASWRDRGGILNNIESIYKNTSGDAIFTALRTEFAYQMIDYSIERWQKEKKCVNFHGKLLIVAPSIIIAKKYYEYIKNKINCTIATSEDSMANTEILKFKKNIYDCLVTVAMAYEGMSVKKITHICVLTHIRSVPWLEQLFARANRVINGKQKAYIIGPKDYFFVSAVKKIKNSYLIKTEKQDENNSILKICDDSELTENKIRGVTPLSSMATNIIIDNIPISIRERNIKQRIRKLRNHIINISNPGTIKSKVTIFNKIIKKCVNKKLDEMTIPELEKVFLSLNNKFAKGGKYAK